MYDYHLRLTDVTYNPVTFTDLTSLVNVNVSVSNTVLGTLEQLVELYKERDWISPVQYGNPKAIVAIKNGNVKPILDNKELIIYDSKFRFSQNGMPIHQQFKAKCVGNVEENTVGRYL